MATVKIDLLETLSSKEPRVGHTIFIAVDGHGGSGKSTLAKWLSEKLNAQIIRCDDFASWDNPLNWWPLLVERVSVPIKGGAKTLSYPRTKWWGERNPEPVVDQPVTSVIILEGVSSSRKEFRDYISLSIFVDAPKELCLQRGLERDAQTTGQTKDQLKQMWEGWAADEDKYMQRDQPKTYADIVIDGTKPFEEQIFVNRHVS